MVWEKLIFNNGRDKTSVIPSKILEIDKLSTSEDTVL
jgi:hypothetical protein